MAGANADANRDSGKEPDVEVVIEDDKASGADDNATAEGDAKKAADSDDAEEGKGEPKKKRRRGNPAPAQINKLLWEKKELEERASRAEQELVAERASRVKMEGITTLSLEKSLAAEGQSLTQQLRDAHAEQDASKIASLTSEISRVEAQKAQLERYKVENSTKPAVQPVKRQETQQQNNESMSFDDLYDTGNHQTRSWLDENREWFHPEGEEYNQHMVDDVTNMAKRLESEWQRNGRGSEIGTKAYYNAVNRYISDNWSNEDDSVEIPPPAQNKSGYAAPVNRRSVNGNPPPRRDVVTLTKSERDMALGIEIKHPNGRAYTDEEKIKEFARNKKIISGTKNSDPITLNMLRKGM